MSSNSMNIRMVDDEYVLLEIKPIMAIYLGIGPIFLILGPASLLSAVVLFPGILSIAVPLSLLATFIGGGVSGLGYLKWTQTTYLLTNLRLISTSGIVQPRRRTDKLCNLQDIDINWIWGTDIGTVKVETAGKSSAVELKWISNPRAVEETIFSAASVAGPNLFSGLGESMNEDEE